MTHLFDVYNSHALVVMHAHTHHRIKHVCTYFCCFFFRHVQLFIGGICSGNAEEPICMTSHEYTAHHRLAILVSAIPALLQCNTHMNFIHPHRLARPRMPTVQTRLLAPARLRRLRGSTAAPSRSTVATRSMLLSVMGRRLPLGMFETHSV